MGKQLVVYRGRSLSCRGSITLFLTGLATLVPFAYSFWLAEYAYTQYGSVAANTWGRTWLTVSALAAVCFLLLAFYNLYLYQRSVAIYSNGIRLRLGFLLTHSYTWEEIQGICSGIFQERFLHLPIRTFHQAILIPKNRKPITLRTPMEKLPEMIDQIKRCVYSRRAPETRSLFLNGERVEFGLFAISNNGMEIRLPTTSRKQFITWNAIQVIDIQSGFIIVQFFKDQIIRIPISKIPNFEIFMEIIQQEVMV